MYKCELILNGTTYDVTNDIKNWDDIKATLKRNNYDGVIRTFSSKFEFVKKAHDLIKEEYRTNYLKSFAYIAIFTLNDVWEYDKRFSCGLDFATYSDDGNTISISGIENSLSDLINANKSQTYDIPVSKLKEDMPLYYDRLVLTNEAAYIPIGDNLEEEKVNIDYTSRNYKDRPGTGSIYLFPMSNVSSDIANKDHFEIYDQHDKSMVVTGWDFPENYFELENYVPPILKCLKDSSCVIKIRSRVSATLLSFFSGYILVNENLIEDIRIFYAVGTHYENGKYYFKTILTTAFKENEGAIINSKIEINMKAGETLCVFCFIPYFNGKDILATVRIDFNEYDKFFGFTYFGRDKAIYIDVISPQKLLSKLLYNMTEREILCEIDTEGREDREIFDCMIMAAESIRGLPEAKIHTSFSKFSDWMKSFGYVYKIEGESIIFMIRPRFFEETIVKHITNVKDFSTSVNESLIYSGVKVGFEKKEYDEVNGRDEFHTTSSFSTGLGMNDSIMELISPYRADPYGIEFLAQKRGENTTDNSSDNDVFFVQVSKKYNRYILFRDPSAISGVLSPETIFNIYYSPRRMLVRNARFIGACTSKLVFTSTDGNADVEIEGTPEKSVVNVDRPLFKVNEISINTPENEFPEDWNGVIEIEYKGEMYYGYIIQTDHNYGKSQSTTYKLIEK